MAEYVTIDLSKKQVDFEHPHHNDKNGKDYVRILAPDSSVFFYPKDSLKENEEDHNRVYFMRPVGTEIKLRSSERIPDAPDNNIPEVMKYITKERVVKIEDLYEMYKANSEAYRAKRQEQNSLYKKMSVPEDWTRKFNAKNGVEYVSVSIPVKEQEGGANYYEFIVASEHFKVDKEHNGHFSFPTKQKDNPDADYLVTLRRSVRVDEGIYENVEKQISSLQLKNAIEAAKNVPEKLKIVVSDKLIRPFKSKNGNELCSVSVPVYSDTQNGVEQKAVFYQIVVPAWRIKKEDNGFGTMITYLTLPDSTDYIFQARHGVKNEATGQYEDEILQLSALDVANKFADSDAIYANKNNEVSADNGAEQENEQDVVRHRGR